MSLGLPVCPLLRDPETQGLDISVWRAHHKIVKTKQIVFFFNFGYFFGFYVIFLVPQLTLHSGRVAQGGSVVAEGGFVAVAVAVGDGTRLQKTGDRWHLICDHFSFCIGTTIWTRFQIQCFLYGEFLINKKKEMVSTCKHIIICYLQVIPFWWVDYIIGLSSDNGK